MPGKAPADLSAEQAAVQDFLKGYGPCTDDEMVEVYPKVYNHVPQSASSLRARRAELVTRGLVEWTGLKVRTPSGGLVRTWRARA